MGRKNSKYNNLAKEIIKELVILRHIRTINVVTYNVRTEGSLENLLYVLTLDDVIKALPDIFDVEAYQWFRRKYHYYRTYVDFMDAFRLQYCRDSERSQRESITMTLLITPDQ